MKERDGKQRGSIINMIADILLPFLIYFAVHDLASILLSFLTGISLAGLGEAYAGFVERHAASISGIWNGLALCAGALAVWPMAKREIQGAEKAGKAGKRPAGRKISEYFILVVCAVSMAVGMNLLLTLTGLTQVSENYTEISTRQYGVAFGLGLALYGVVSPVAEEIVFRGLIYNRMKRHLKTWVSVLLCGALFGIYHGNLVQGIYGCVLGIGITLMYEWYGNMLAPVLFHGAANVGVFVMSYNAEAFQGMATPAFCVVALTAGLVLSVVCKKSV